MLLSTSGELLHQKTFPVCTKQFLGHPCSKTGVKLWTLKFEGISFDIFWCLLSLNQKARVLWKIRQMGGNA